MSRQAMETLMDRWMNEPTFRAEMRQDPATAVKAAGVVLDEAEWAALRAVDWSQSDEQLKARVSRGA